MLSKEKLQELLGLAMRSEADFAEIFEEETNSEAISMINEDVQDINQSERAGVGIRLYKGVSSVYGFTDDLSDEALEQIVNDLRQAVGEKEEGPEIVLTEQETVENSVQVQDPFETSQDDKIELLVRMKDAARNADEKIVKATTSLSAVRQNVQIANSEGMLKKDVRHRSRLTTQAYADRDGNMQSGHNSAGSTQGLEYFTGSYSPEAIGKEAARTALVLLDAIPAPSGRMPVIIDNGFGGVIFHESCGHSLEATGVAKNQSVFAGKLGEKIANEKVTAIDDGTIPGSWGSQNIDDEGTPQQKRVLIENGILKSYMIDRLNSRRMGMEPTGSSRRESYKYEPTSRMSNTYIAPGTDKKEDMFKGIKKGLYCRKMGGGSVNPNTGEFNFGVNEGYLIEDGKVTKPVIGAMLIGSGAEILQNIDMVGDELELAPGMCGSVSGSVPTNVGQPAIRVSSITVGGTDNE